MLRYIILLAFIAVSTAFILDEDLCVEGIEFVAHPNCSQFYHCSNGVPILQDCPEGYFFNPRLEICDYPANVPECQGGTRPPTTSTTPTAPTNATTTPITSTTPTTPTNATTPTTTAPITSTTPSPFTETPCNTVLNDTSGHIAHKLNSTTGDLERCAWTINVPGASKFRFILQQGDFEYRYDAITVLGLSRDGDQVSRQSITIMDTSAIYELNDSIAIVMFHTDSSTASTGFLLSYVVETNADEALLSVNEIGYTNNTQGYSFVRGVGEELYANNELTTLLHVAVPGANFSSLGHTHFADNCDKDYILVFKFKQPGADAFWEAGDRVCNSHTDFIWATHNDVVLYVFKSNEANADEGFYLNLSSKE